MAPHDHPLSMCTYTYYYPTAYKLLLYRESRLSGAIFISHMHTRKLKVLIYSEPTRGQQYNNNNC